MATNDRQLLGADGVNSKWQNVLMGAVTVVCAVLGGRGLLAAGAGLLAWW
jgi:hypothetical protein